MRCRSASLTSSVCRQAQRHRVVHRPHAWCSLVVRRPPAWWLQPALLPGVSLVRCWARVKQECRVRRTPPTRAQTRFPRHTVSTVPSSCSYVMCGNGIQDAGMDAFVPQRVGKRHKVLLQQCGQVHDAVSSQGKGTTRRCIRCGRAAIRTDGQTRLGGQRSSGCGQYAGSETAALLIVRDANP